MSTASIKETLLQEVSALPSDYYSDVLNYDERDVKMSLASRLYADEKLTSGQAAQLVGISKREFIEQLGTYSVSLFSESVEDLIHDVANA